MNDQDEFPKWDWNDVVDIVLTSAIVFMIAVVLALLIHATGWYQ